MRIVVCLKGVGDPQAARYDFVRREVVDLSPIVNPLDLVALEEGLRLRERHGGEVTALTCGLPSAAWVLRRALTTGVDKGVLVETEAEEFFTVASVLAAAVRRIGCDLLLCGARSADTAQEIVGTATAELLGLPLVTRAVRIETTAGKQTLRVYKKIPKGKREVYEVELPAVISLEEGANVPRYVAILSKTYVRGIERPVERMSLKELGMTGARLHSGVHTLRITAPKPRVQVGVSVTGLSPAQKLQLLMGGGQKRGEEKEILSGSPERAARRLVERLREWLTDASPPSSA